MTARLPEAGSVRVRETDDELVVEMAVPHEVELQQLAARLHDGVLTISVPRSAASGASAPSR